MRDKILPEEKLVELIHGLERPVVLLGGPEDRERGEGVARLTGGKVYNASGQFSLGQSAALVKHALVVITNDTGLMHVAAAFRKPIVSIWGNTIPEFGMYPYMPKEGPPAYLAEVAGLRCRPCSKIGHERCPKGHFRCMMDQDTAKICDAVKRMAESATGSVGL